MRLPRRNKYHAKPTMLGGERYDSRAEAHYAALLEIMKTAGGIVDWKRGERMALIDGPTAMERVTYRPDFMVTIHAQPRECMDTRQGHEGCWKIEAHDVKGVLHRETRIKALLWRQRYPHIPLRFVDAKGRERDIFARKTARKARAA